MMPESRYTTNLSKAQGIVSETLELLELWEPGMSVGELKTRVRTMGALGKATQARVDDVVGRAFAQRYLTADGSPARWLQRLLAAGAPRRLLLQLTLLYTARANLILHDFIREVYWLKDASGAGEVTKQDARDFIERAVSRGALERRWSDAMEEKVTRYLLGTLVDFQLIEDNRYGQRQIRPLLVLPETVIFLAYDLHFGGTPDEELVRHRDWGLFGLSANAVIAFLQNVAMLGHLFVQHSGAIIRVEWKHGTMEDVLDAIAH